MCFLVSAALLLHREEFPCAVFDLLRHRGYFGHCRALLSLLESCVHVILSPLGRICIHIIATSASSPLSERFTEPPTRQEMIPCQIPAARICKTTQFRSGIFLPVRQAAGMYSRAAPLRSPDAARPSRLQSPGPDLILGHQLFPGSPGSPHASRSEKMCFTL